MLDGIKDSRVKLISFKENKGLAAALNACIDVASGKYIARQDDDDISLPERFEKQTEYLEITVILISSEQIASFIRRAKVYTASV